jgi:protein-S-isoprenylcysteine O-methyltransferase Ste14
MSADTSGTLDTAQVLVRPPLAWAISAVVGIALGWLIPLQFVPFSLPAAWLGGIVFALAVVLFAWAVTTMMRGGSNVPTSMPSKTIVASGPYRFTRNPIYLGMIVSLIGLAIAFDSVWSLVALVVFFLVIRFGVVAREEAYLERKFGDVYRSYRAHVRRWL